MSIFHVGQRVACIDATTRLVVLPENCTLPTKGGVYHVRGGYRNPGWNDQYILLLEEIVNPICRAWGLEYGFCSSRFRPVKPTSIEVFHQLLSPIHERETV